jgi:hypothetical protein
MDELKHKIQTQQNFSKPNGPNPDGPVLSCDHYEEIAALDNAMSSKTAELK